MEKKLSDEEYKVLGIRYYCICGPRNILEEVRTPFKMRRECYYGGPDIDTLEDANRWIAENAPRLEGFELLAIERIARHPKPMRAEPLQDGSEDARILRMTY